MTGKHNRNHFPDAAVLTDWLFTDPDLARILDGITQKVVLAVLMYNITQTQSWHAKCELCSAQHHCSAGYLQSIQTLEQRDMNWKLWPTLYNVWNWNETIEAIARMVINKRLRRGICDKTGIRRMFLAFHCEAVTAGKNHTKSIHRRACAIGKERFQGYLWPLEPQWIKIEFSKLLCC